MIYLSIWLIINVTIIMKHIEKISKPSKIEDIYIKNIKSDMFMFIYFNGIFSYLFIKKIREIRQMNYIEDVIYNLKMYNNDNNKVVLYKRKLKLMKLDKKVSRQNKIKKLKFWKH